MVAIPKKVKTVTVHKDSWDPSETVTLKTFVGSWDREKILSSSTEYRRDDNDQMIIVATLDKMHLTKRQVGIVGWTLRDADGDPLPFNLENIKLLPQEDAEYIDQQLDSLWGMLGEPVASKEEAQAIEQQDKQDRGDFRPDGLSADEGGALNGRADGAEGTGNTGRNRTGAKNT